jgi:hypothetical protein
MVASNSRLQGWNGRVVSVLVNADIIIKRMTKSIRCYREK